MITHAARFSFCIALAAGCSFTPIAWADALPQAKVDTQTIGGGEPSTRWQGFNEGWLFFRGDAEENPIPREGIGGFLLQAMTPEQRPVAWRRVVLPHDWGVEDLDPEKHPEAIGPFSPKSHGRDVAHTVGGVGWYRKEFVTNRREESDRILVHFDGVSTHAVVYVNNVAMGSHGNPYTPFTIDVTELLEPDGQANVIAVRVENRGYNSRWYRGSGIYRSVTASVIPKTALNAETPRVVATPLDDGSARIKVVADVVGAPQGWRGEARVEVVDEATDEVVATTGLALKDEGQIGGVCHVPAAKLWSPDSPTLYEARITLLKGDMVVDRLRIPFGVRSIEFSAEQGFVINGTPTLLKGCNVHHDNGLLGAEAWRAADARRVQRLKASGFNAIRCSHNPPSASFLDACDRLGMLVIDEAFDVWRLPKRPADNHLRFADHWREDLRAMMLRDRNRPSVIMWSIGNEVTERARSHGVRTAQQLASEVRRYDDTRPVTNGICDFWDNSDQEWDDTADAFAVLDVGGYNYMAKAYESDHEKHPDRVMYASEAFAKYAHWQWEKVERLPYVIGDFVWTGIDYLGEAGLAHSYYADDAATGGYSRDWPWFVAWCGDLDLLGDKKAQGRFRDVLWDVSDLEVLVHEPIPDGKVEVVNYWGWPKERAHWNWPEAVGTPLQVNVYSKLKNVELRLNGELIEPSATQPEIGLTTRFEAPYREGTLEASAVNAAGDRVTKTLRTTGSPTRVAVSVEPTINGFDDGPRFVRIEIQDAAGRLVPTAEIDVELKLRGGELMAAGSASPNRMASFTQPKVTTFRGRGLVVVMPTGSASLGVTATGLVGGKLAF